MKKSLTKKRVAKRTTTSTFNVDIAQEFKDVKTEIGGLKNEISQWRNTVDVQLTRLNTNMDKVLSQIADHEGRITDLEKKSTQDQTRRETLSEAAKFGWVAAKLILAIGAIIGSVGGCAWVLKLLNVC